MKFLLYVFMMSMSFSQVNALTAEQEIQRLEKGEYYFHYLTHDFPAAMTQLSYLSAHQNENDELDVMKAAMLLSLGLHAQAQEIFEKIQRDKGVSSSQSWFYLARRWFELGEHYNTVYCLQQMNIEDIKLEYQLESQFMISSSYMELGEHKKAQKLIEKMPRSSIWTGYARHNYIIEMMLGNNSGRSLNLLIEDSTFYLPDTKEGRDLRDRINLVSAIHYLELGKNRSANKYLKQISLAGPYTPAALLQYGWVNAEQGDYEAALQPWRELQTRFNRFDPDVMESMLGVPQLFELMGAYSQAIKSFESIEKRLLAMKDFIGITRQNLSSGQWLDEWVTVQPDSGWGWQSELDSTAPFGDSSGLLQNLLAEDLIVSGIREYRDLVVLSQYLREKEKNLRLWQSMVKKRKVAAQNRNLSPIFNRANQSILRAESEYQQLMAYYQDSEQNIFAFPTEKQQLSIDSLTRSTLNIETLMQTNSATRDLASYKERWARVKGVLLWQMNEAQPNMQWQLKRDLAKTNKYVNQAKRQLLETRLADKWSDSSWQGLDVRVNTLLLKTQQLHKQASSATAEAKEKLLLKSDHFLTALHQRINEYLAHSRLSIARLYDDALQRQVVQGGLPSVGEQ